MLGFLKRGGAALLRPWMQRGSVSLDDVIDSLNAGGYPPLQVGGRYFTRDLASTYATVFRCVTLIAGVIGELIAFGAWVQDRDGKRVKSAHNTRMLDFLRETPDGIVPAHSWVEDLVTDYLLDGNFIVYVDGPLSAPTKLRLMESWGARAYSTQGRVPVYQARESDFDDSALEMAPVQRVVHGRWPRLTGRRTGSSWRGRWFAAPPVQVLHQAINTGIQADRYVGEYFGDANRSGGGVRSRLGISFKERANEEVQNRVVKSIQAYARSRHPLVLWGDPTITPIKDSPQDSDALKLREFQVREVGRAYGIPAPLLGENVTQWGQGIEQLARLFFRFAGRHHLSRVLAGFSMRLLPSGQRFMCDETELLRGDTEAITRLLAMTGGDAQRRRVLSVEEQRRLLGVEPDAVPPDDRVGRGPCPAP